MKDFSLLSIYAIAADMFGAWFWPAIAVAALLALLFLRALWRRRGFRGTAARTALVIGLLGAVVAAAVAPFSTQASFANIHGAVDWAMLALIGAGAFLGLTVAAYALLGLAARPA